MGSVSVTDKRLIRRFTADPEFPFLISFPRTGSHWLRMITELYFERPTLVRVFYYPKRKDYLLLHTHDMDLDIYRKNVIYLYRDPVPTVYSQMMYEKEDVNDEERVRSWANYYARHLRKWLLEERESVKKTIIRYENMRVNIHREFAKVTEHFGQVLVPEKLDMAVERISKEEVRKKTTHDQQVINLDQSYEELRAAFVRERGELIYEVVFRETPNLRAFFD